MRTTPPPARRKHTRLEHGFTLVELLMTMLVSSLIMIGVYAAFEMQNRTHNAQEQNVDMQQNIRAPLTLLSSDIRMAGFDPSGTEFKQSDPVIIRAEQGWITFVTVVWNETKKKFEKKYVSYRLGFRYDKDDDGVVEVTPRELEDDDEFGLTVYSPSLIRCVGDGEEECDDRNNTNWQAVARGVEALEFVYQYSDTDYGLWGKNEAKSVKGKDVRKDIRAVTISLLMRADTPDRRISPAASELRPASVLLHRKTRGIRANTWSTVIKRKIAMDRDSREGESQHRRRLLYTTVQMRNSDVVKQ